MRLSLSLIAIAAAAETRVTADQMAPFGPAGGTRLSIDQSAKLTERKQAEWSDDTRVNIACMTAAGGETYHLIRIRMFKTTDKGLIPVQWTVADTGVPCD